MGCRRAAQRGVGRAGPRGTPTYRAPPTPKAVKDTAKRGQVAPGQGTAASPSPGRRHPLPARGPSWRTLARAFPANQDEPGGSRGRSQLQRCHRAPRARTSRCSEAAGRTLLVDDDRTRGSQRCSPRAKRPCGPGAGGGRGDSSHRTPCRWPPRSHGHGEARGPDTRLASWSRAAARGFVPQEGRAPAGRLASPPPPLPSPATSALARKGWLGAQPGRARQAVGTPPAPDRPSQGRQGPRGPGEP